MTVLVVEDDSVILEGLRFALTQEGYQVMTAASAAEAMERRVSFSSARRA